MDKIIRASPHTGGMEFRRHAVISIHEGRDLIEGSSNKANKVYQYGVTISLNSKRLKMFFISGLDCKYEGCSRVGNSFAIERHSSGVWTYHLNLYGTSPEDKTPMLFTCDHRKARSLGGSNKYSNLQTMCFYHNNLKSASEGSTGAMKACREVPPSSSGHVSDILPLRDLSRVSIEYRSQGIPCSASL